MPTPTTDQHLPEKIELLFKQHGVNVHQTEADQLVCDCPLCGKEKHFFVSIHPDKSGQWDCKVCASSGNKYTFLEQLYRKHLDLTKAADYNKLAKRRTAPVDVYKRAKLAFNPITSQWMIPIRNTQGSMVNMKVYEPKDKSLFMTSTCKAHFYNQEHLKSTGTVLICEGEWDAMMLEYIISRDPKIKKEGYSVLAVPGSGSIPKNFDELLRGRVVYLLYDNDEAGQNGMSRMISKLTGVARKVYAIEWPESFPEKFDVSDYFNQNLDNISESFTRLLDLCSAVDFKSLKTTAEVGVVPKDFAPRTTIAEVFKDFEDSGVHMTRYLRDGLVVSIAVTQSIKIQGDPVWIFLVGPPGGGKSLILDAFRDNPGCVYQSNITRQGLFSGYDSKDGDDGSLMNAIMGNCLVLKDFTETLTLPAQAQEELYGFLRGAFDGYISRVFGNNVVRTFPPPGSELTTCHFSLVAGVTSQIHGQSRAELGERFLKMAVTEEKFDFSEQINAAITQAEQSELEIERKLLRQHSVASFLQNKPLDPNNLPTMPEWFRNRVIGLAQTTAYLRAHVSRGVGGEMNYRPTPEVGTRLARQFVKLAQCIGHVLDKKTLDDEVYQYVVEVAITTAYGWAKDIAMYLYTHGKTSRLDLMSALAMSSGTCSRTIANLTELRIVQEAPIHQDTPGRPQKEYILTPEFRDVLNGAKLKGYLEHAEEPTPPPKKARAKKATTRKAPPKIARRAVRARVKVR